MLSPTTVGASVDNLTALIEVIRNPDKYKEEIDELRRESKQFEDAREGFIKESAELQALRRDVERLFVDVSKITEELKGIMEKASRLVTDSVIYKAETDRKTVEVVAEAKKLVLEMTEAARGTAEVFRQKADEQEARLLQLDKEVTMKEAKLADVETRLQVLRDSMGG